ncbi:MAG: hypothetical protein HUK07_08330, partial [Bacteroidaceae bacterium]|nr:hypothetical protein [Bacteroidaceae bacterium]
MTVGIFYICTGKYSIFWETFYKSAEKYLLPDCTREYFVFTDDEKILPTEHIHVYYERAKGFPLDSLLRFELFLRVEDDTKNCDYLYFFNSNMQFIRTITVEMFLPTEAECGLAALRHPGYYNKGAFWLPYERRKKSM